MYNVQNTSGRNIALMLERGGFVFRPGKYLDLDTLCSRPWIAASYDVRRLLETGAIRLVHDSLVDIPQQPTKVITRYKTAAGKNMVVSANKVEVLDLSQHPDVEVDELGRVHTPAVDSQPNSEGPLVEAVLDVAALSPRPEPVSLEVAVEKPHEAPQELQKFVQDLVTAEVELEEPLVVVPEAKAVAPTEPIASYKSNKKNKKKKHHYPSTDDPVEQMFSTLNK